MSPIALRYLASREWMESEILAGRPIQRRDQQLSIDLNQIGVDLRRRVEAVADAVVTTLTKKKRRIYVLDSGIDAELSFGPNKEALERLDAPILDEIGVLPELPKPSEDVDEVVTAWEGWLDAYQTLALGLIKRLCASPPAVLESENPFIDDLEWGSVEITFGDGLGGRVTIEDGPGAIRDARAGRLWNWAASRRFSSESYAAARAATDADPSEGRSWLNVLPPEKLAELFLHRKKQLFTAAKAHHVARLSKVPDFETEMERWAAEHGSARLRLGIEDGYRMNARYLAERLAAEAPGMYAMSASGTKDDWAYKAGSPSEEGLRLRRRIAAALERSAPPNLDGKPEAEIVIVKRPPPELYLADPGVQTEFGTMGVDLPRRDGWPWYIDGHDNFVGEGPVPFEAVVVKHWLGKYHLIGGVRDEFGNGPAGVWALPDPDHFGEDGVVQAQDPDAPAPEKAKRKPPETEKDDDIPF